MNHPAATQLIIFAQEERARRKAGWHSVGKGQSEGAKQDDALWWHIERFMRHLAGDDRPPRHHGGAAKDAMIANLRTTYRKALVAFDAKPEHHPKIFALRELLYALEFTLLYTKEHPIPIHRERAAA